MNVFQTFKMAIKTMFDNKVRTILTMLGVIIGVATFITLVSLGEGTKKSINDKIESMGTNLISINIMARNSSRSITYEDLEEFSSKNSNEIEAIAPKISNSASIKYNQKTWDTTVEGTSPEYEIIKGVHVGSGRFITDADVDSRRSVIILGQAVVNNLFDTGVNPIGQTVKISGKGYKVIGVLETVAQGQDYSSDDKTIIPISVAQRNFKSSQIRNFDIQAKSKDTIDSAKEKIEELLLKYYNDESSFRVMNQAEMLEQVNDITGTLTLFLGFIAGISLFVGGIGIMNIMLVTVSERTREIGIRKAIGAKRKHILIQFLIESIIISCFGGVFGILLGTAISYIIASVMSIPSVITVSSVMISFSVSAIVGIFFGIYPANKASKLNPIEALSFE